MVWTDQKGRARGGRALAPAAPPTTMRAADPRCAATIAAIDTELRNWDLVRARVSDGTA